MNEDRQIISQVQRLTTEQWATIDKAVANLESQILSVGLERAKGRLELIYSTLIHQSVCSRFMRAELLCRLLAVVAEQLVSTLRRDVRCSDLQEYCDRIAASEIARRYAFLDPEYCEPLEIAGFQLLKGIDGGNQYSIYEAVNRSSERKAIKYSETSSVDAIHLANEHSIIKKVLTERALGLPHLVSGLEFANTSSHTVLAVDIVQGQHLGRIVSDNPDLALEPRAACQLGYKLCLALAQIHRCGVLHLDVSPANVILKDADIDNPSPVLIDFGLAIDTSVANRELDTTILLGLGTRSFQSPELKEIGFDSPEEVNVQRLSERTDIFSLARLIGYAATGRLSNSTGQFDTNLRTTLSVSRRLRKCLLKASEHDPAKRYRNAMAFASALKSCDIAPERKWKLATIITSVAAVVFALIAVLLTTNPGYQATPEIPAQLRSDIQTLNNELAKNRNRSWIEQLAIEKNIELDSISTENFNIRSNVTAVVDQATFTATVFVNLDPRLAGFEAAIEGRVVGTGWSPANVVGGGESALYFSAVSLTPGRKLQLRLNSDVGSPKGFLVGPFDFDLDLGSKIQEIENARLSDTKQTIHQREWLAYKPNQSTQHWYFTEAFSYPFATSIEEIAFSTDGQNFPYVFPSLSLVIQTNKQSIKVSSYSIIDETVAASNIADMLSLMLSKHIPPLFRQYDSIWVKARFVDGSFSSPIQFWKPPYALSSGMNESQRSAAVRSVFEFEAKVENPGQRKTFKFTDQFARQYWPKSLAVHLGSSMDDLSCALSLLATPKRLREWGVSIRSGTPQSFMLSKILEECPQRLQTTDNLFWQLEFSSGVRSKICRITVDRPNAVIVAE